VAHEIFSDFINKNKLNGDQIYFVNTIIKFLNINGTIDKEMLFTQPPFTEKNDQGAIGLFSEAKIIELLNIIQDVNQNSVVA